jgi:biopolymer transport protein ExbD
VPPSAGNLNHPVNVIAVHPDGTIKFRGVTMGLAEFQSKLKAAVKATPDQSFLIEAGTKVPYEKLKAVIDSCSDAQVKSVSVSIYAEGSVPEKTPPTAPANPATPATNPPPPAAAPATTAAPAPPAPPSPAGPAAIRAVVRVDGKINFQGLTYDLPGFKSKLEALMKATPDQAIVIKAGKTVPYEDFKAVLDICHAAQVKNLTVAAPAPTPGPVEPAVVKPAATNLPAPSLLMHPPADSMSSNAPPMSPSGLRAPTPSAPNTPAPANP